MQLAIRRVLPTARQQLSRPHRLGRISSSRPSPATTAAPPRPCRCFTSSATKLRQSDSNASSSPVEQPAEPATDVDTRESEKPGETAPPAVRQPSTDVDGAAEAGAEGAGEGVLSAADAPEEKPRGRGRPKVVRRVVAAKKTELPKPVLPTWYLESSVLLREDLAVEQAHQEELEREARQAVAEQAAETKGDGESQDTPLAGVAETGVAEKQSRRKQKEEPKDDVMTSEETAADASKAEEVETSTEEAKESLRSRYRNAYQIHESVWDEIEAHVRTGLTLPKGVFAESMASRKTHCLLHLPKEGGVYFLDIVAERLAAEAEADLIRLDAQDLAEIGGDYLGDSSQKSPSDLSSFELRSLGYDTQAQIMETLDEAYAEEEEEAEDASDEIFEEEEDSFARGTRPNQMYETGVSINASGIGDAIRQLMGGRLLGTMIVDPTGRSGGLGPDASNEKKMTLLLDTMISAAETKRRQQSSPDETSEATDIPPVGKTLIHVRDYRELERTNSGQAVLKMLHNIVASRRQSGEQILILGTSSAEEEPASYTKSGVRALQSRSEDSLERTIVVPPMVETVDEEVFRLDRDSRVREVNIRHLRDVIRRRSGDDGNSITLDIPKDWHLKIEATESIPGIADNIWNFDHVHRVASVALGRLRPSATLTISDIVAAIDIIERSDNVKYDWAMKEYELMKSRVESESDVADAKETAKAKLANISKTATKHEKGLLGGVIDPASIKSGFSSVRAAPETIDAMKTLTTLSLIRPDAFKYGVLATDRIPGVLLYGPPGTGKTLLAKAVAKESGATVLEVDGASVSDMYVGESEKNVKAIFSLAKKLSPCVIFIDEADAIFGSRQSLTGRSSHRETINQFLKEWADMTSTAFIMVATNRPFDLDDAILRRLPRRILLDLPTAEDRLEILKLHLAGETLDPEVDLKAIADSTPLYSGSDCKNLAVGAALNCVRDEIKQFETSGAYPEKRIIRKDHFEAALKEISPSISDDMGSLTLIRKFDEKYGERAGHKKKIKSWGFELGQTQAQKMTESRVRMD